MPSRSPSPPLSTSSPPTKATTRPSSRSPSPPPLGLSISTEVPSKAGHQEQQTQQAGGAGGGGNAFSRFISKIEFKSPAFDFGRAGGAGRGKQEERKSLVSLAGVPLVEAEDHHHHPRNSKKGKRGKEGRGTVIGITAMGERVHEREDDFGISAVVQWSSPIK